MLMLSEGEITSTDPSFPHSVGSPHPVLWSPFSLVGEVKARGCAPAPHLQVGWLYAGRPMLGLVEEPSKAREKM